MKVEPGLLDEVALTLYAVPPQEDDTSMPFLDQQPMAVRVGVGVRVVCVCSKNEKRGVVLLSCLCPSFVHASITTCDFGITLDVCVSLCVRV